MKYTIQQGVERAFSERIKGNLQILIPLLVVLAGVTAWALMPHGNHQKPQTLGIYTVKTPDQASATSNNSKDKNNKDAAAGGTSSAATPGTISPIAGRSASLGARSGGLGGAVSPVTGTTTGGLGGGLGGGGGTGGGGVSTPPAPTATCVNTGGITPLTCTACTPPLLVPVGQKVLLYNNGTCVLAN